MAGGGRQRGLERGLAHYIAGMVVFVLAAVFLVQLASHGGLVPALQRTAADLRATDATQSDLRTHDDVMSPIESPFVSSPTDCKLCGTVDDCSCTYKTVTSWNTKEFFPKLSTLVRNKFFKYFYVNLYGECTLWQSGEDDLCTSPTCTVDECEDTNQLLSGFHEEKRAVISYTDYSCLGLNEINDTVSAQETKQLDIEHMSDALDRSNFCVPDELIFSRNEMKYVNLIDNPERFTGYSGPSAHRIWKTVYGSNCFKPQGVSFFDPSAVDLSAFGQPGLDDLLVDAAAIGDGNMDEEEMCLEQRVFYRLLSGVHASISVHLSYKWLDQETGTFRPNVTEFRRRFSDHTTAGQGSKWLKNLYFTYLTVMKAIAKSEKLWESYDFSSGDPQEEDSAKAMVLALVAEAKKYADLGVDEDLLFQSKDREYLLLEMTEHLRSITDAMNCVGCMKCRLWGKLQTRGLATAVRLLLGSKISSEQVAFELGRNDIVAIFNLWERLASSITYMQRFQTMADKPIILFDE